MGLRKGEFIDKNITSVNKVIKVLTALNTGRSIKLGDYVFKISETLNGGFQPLIEFNCSNSQGEEWIEYLDFQGSFSAFTELCNNLTDDEITIICAENVLNEINKISKKNKNRKRILIK